MEKVAEDAAIESRLLADGEEDRRVVRDCAHRKRKKKRNIRYYYRR
jgi:hypothetical protein